jgi:hypothetical protein
MGVVVLWHLYDLGLWVQCLKLEHHPSGKKNKNFKKAKESTVKRLLL